MLSFWYSNEKPDNGYLIHLWVMWIMLSEWDVDFVYVARIKLDFYHMHDQQHTACNKTQQYIPECTYTVGTRHINLRVGFSNYAQLKHKSIMLCGCTLCRTCCYCMANAVTKRCFRKKMRIALLHTLFIASSFGCRAKFTYVLFISKKNV